MATLSVSGRDDGRPRGFMRLPPELRVKVYEYYFAAPMLGIICKCSILSSCHGMEHQIRNHIATTSSTEERHGRSWGCTCWTCNYSGALLLTSKQIRNEALPLLEDTFQLSLNIAGTDGRGFGHDWIFTTGNDSLLGWRLDRSLVKQNPAKLERLIKAPKCIEVLNIHIDTWELDDDMEELPKLLDQLRPLHVIADRMTFVIDVHVCRAWMEVVPGWSEVFEEASGDWKLDAKELVRAKDMRAKVVRGLEMEFAREGKVLRLQEVEAVEEDPEP
ncbi:hypothetical protein Slin15195_G125950 [Septoria linicola]|uniref:Uncharacterized protein n=1 Tax=Septoria linicola TaxID=215465 RepID=A0A9Q9BAB5_9PEZI|nr:hypothetical protein Slin14017_G082130 [Septoria linicola]USW59276.1 hypothetical protein Slin15195_G125950 [Septoria linicola]